MKSYTVLVMFSNMTQIAWDSDKTRGRIHNNLFCWLSMGRSEFATKVPADRLKARHIIGCRLMITSFQLCVHAVSACFLRRKQPRSRRPHNAGSGDGITACSQHRNKEGLVSYNKAMPKSRISYFHFGLQSSDTRQVPDLHTSSYTNT